MQKAKWQYETSCVTVLTFQRYEPLKSPSLSNLILCVLEYEYSCWSHLSGNPIPRVVPQIFSSKRELRTRLRSEIYFYKRNVRLWKTRVIAYLITEKNTVFRDTL